MTDHIDKQHLFFHSQVIFLSVYLFSFHLDCSLLFNQKIKLIVADSQSNICHQIHATNKGRCYLYQIFLHVILRSMISKQSGSQSWDFGSHWSLTSHYFKRYIMLTYQLWETNAILPKITKNATFRKKNKTKVNYLNNSRILTGKLSSTLKITKLIYHKNYQLS